MKIRPISLLILALLAAITITLAKSSSANDWKIVPGERIGDASLSMSVEDILNTLLRETWLLDDGSKVHRFWENHLITVAAVSNSVDSIATSWFRTRSQPYKTEKGIGIGSTKDQVRDAYTGEELVTTVFARAVSGDIFGAFVYPQLGISFFFQDSPDAPSEIRERVWAIKITRRGSDPQSLAAPPGVPFNTTRAHDWKVIPNDRVGDIRLSMSIEAILKVLGPPSALDRDRIGDMVLVSYRWWKNHLLNVTVLEGFQFPLAISTLWLDGRAHPYVTDKGVKMKDTEQQVRDAYKGEELEVRNTADTSFLRYRKLGVWFAVGRGLPSVPEEIRGRVKALGVEPRER